MRRRDVLRAAGGVRLATWSRHEGKSFRNVLMVISDDLNTGLGCYGQELVRSPNIDGLARRGTRFEHAYCQYPLCNPSRASFLSGRHPARTKVLDNNTPLRYSVPGLLTIPQHFRSNGYRVARVSKVFHIDDPVSWAEVTPPVQRRRSGWNAWVEPVDQNHLELVERLRGFNTPRVAPGGGETLRDYQTATEAITLLEELQAEKRPFFLAAGFSNPHVPFHVPRQYYDLHNAEQVRLPSDFAPTPGWKGAPDAAFRPNVDLFLNEAATEAKARQLTAAYYACIGFMDAQLGRVLDALDRLGLAGDTIVVFLGDNGWHLGQKGMWAKFTLFEQSARVPLIIADPRAKNGGAVCRRVVELVDLFPTLLELCGLPKPPGLDGRSLVPLLKKPGHSWNKSALTVMLPRGRLARSIRTERWRYTEWDEGREGSELYDHAHDPAEMKNLARDSQYAKVIGGLRRLVREREGAPND